MAHGYETVAGDCVYRKLFVGGLAWETKNDTLHRYFEQFGYIIEAVVITHKNTGRSKGYGFVTFRDPESAQRACANPSPVIGGRRANCNLAYFGRSRSDLQSRGCPMPAMLTFASPAHHYSYQPGICWYPAYGPGYFSMQGVCPPYEGQHYFQVYGAPGIVNSHGQLCHPYPSSHDSATIHSHDNGAIATQIPVIQPPYLTGAAARSWAVPNNCSSSFS